MSFDDLAEKWLGLKSQLIQLRRDIKETQTLLGLDDTRDRGPYDGTNLSEYQCEKCKHDWLCATAVPCQQCHSEAYAAIQRATRKLSSQSPVA